MYALSLETETNRILSASEVNEFTPEEQPRVNELPDGDISDYLYVNGEYVYEPLPKPDNEAREQASKEKQKQIDSATENELSDVIKQHDDLSVELYESLSESTITNTTVFSESYARKIMRNEIELTDVPSELQDEVETIYANKQLVPFTINGEGLTFDNKDELNKNLHQETIINIQIKGNDNYFVPPLEQLLDYSVFEASGIDNFYERYCTYRFIDNTNATLSVVIPNWNRNSAFGITIEINGIYRGRVSKK